MSSQGHEERARRYIEEVWNQGDLDVVAELFADRWVVHSSSHEHVEDADDPGRHVGTARNAFDDFGMGIEFQVAEDDVIAIGLTISGTHAGELTGLEPSNEPVAVPGTMACRFESGTTAGSSIHWAVHGFRHQIGAALGDPQPGTAGG